MSFQNPWGALLFLGIPVLIIIYIIKARHEEKAVSSTYLWKLSERFRKKKRLPFHRTEKIFLFILRLLAVTVGALLACRPVLTDRANKDYILIVDASASMLTEDEEGECRFDRAIEQLLEMTDKVNFGHTVSIIVASDEPYYAVKQSTAQNEIQLAVKNLSCTEGTFSLEKALALSGEISSRSENPQVYIYTDQTCDEGMTGKMVEIVDLSSEEEAENISLRSLYWQREKDATVFTGTAICFGKDRDVAVGLKVDGKTVDAVKVSLEDGVLTEVVFREEPMDFEKAEIFIEEKDSFLLDNRYILTVKKTTPKKVLLVGKSTYYLEKAFSVFENCKVVTMRECTDEDLYGYDMYVFDGVPLRILPDDGSCIFINCDKLPSGISMGDAVKSAGEPEYNIDCIAGVGNGILFENWAISAYRPLISNASWNTVLSLNSDTVAAMKTYKNGYTDTVFSFDLHDSNLPITPYFISFLQKIVEYSCPEFVNVTDVNVGEQIVFYPPAGCDSVTVEDAHQAVYQPDSKEKRAEFVPDKTGVYTVTGLGGKEQIRKATFYAHVSPQETEKGSLESLPIIPYDSISAASAESATSDITFYLAVALLVILLIEWGVYYREQY